MAALGINSGTVARELTVVGREVANGNFTRLAGSLTILGQNTNIAALAFKLLTNPVVIFHGRSRRCCRHNRETGRQRRAIGPWGTAAIQTSFAATGQSALLSTQQISDYIDLLAKLPATTEKDAPGDRSRNSRACRTSRPDTFGRAVMDLAGFSALLGTDAPHAAKVLPMH